MGRLLQGILLASLTLAIGCDLSPPGAKKVGAPGGLAPADFDASNPGQANPPAQQPQMAAAQPQPQNPPVNPAPPANDGKGIIGKTTAKIVDYTQYKDNPNYRVIESKAAGDDPLTFAMSAYVNIRSQASLLGIQAAIKQHRIVEERNLTYDELIQMMRDHRVEFTALYPWHMYAYDPSTGAIMILEDVQAKAQRDAQGN